MSAKAKGWVEDRDDDFVHRGEHRSGWNENGKSTSQYLLGGKEPKSGESQIKEVYQLCRNRAEIMASGKPVKVTFTPQEDTGRTDGKRIVISTKVMDEKKTFNEKADIMIGLTTHETAHVLHTDFPMVKAEITDEFTHGVWNVIEDERIEHIVGEETPGYMESVARTKQYFFEEKYLLEKAAKTGMKLDPKDVKEAMDNRASAPAPTANSPTIKRDDDDEQYEDEEDEYNQKMAKRTAVPGHLKAEDDEEAPSPLTATMTDEEKAATEICDTVLRLIRYPTELDDDLISKHETVLDEVKKILTPYPKTPGEAIVASRKVARTVKKNIEDNTGMSGKGLQNLLNNLGVMMNSHDSANEQEELPEEEISQKAMRYDYTEEHIEDPDWKAVFRIGRPAKSKYDAMLREVRGDAGRLAQVMFTKVFNENKTLKGMRSGELDGGKIIEAYAGSKTVHLQHIARVDKKVNVVVLIDESGSMAGGKDRDAAKCAVLLEHAYKLFPVGQLFMYGFTSEYMGDYNTVFRYKEPGLDVKWGLGSVRGRICNRDGHCIRAVARRVRTFTQDPMLFFVISDGCPNGQDYTGTGALKDTRNAVLEISKMNFFPIQIGIGGPGGIDEHTQKQMFDDYVNYTSSRQMVEEMRKLLLRRANRFMGV